ncbi:MAG: tRNA lysidine(34) synthetase TilS [Syntrophobacteraceae bacterium]|nr:tRNA lysidine(34) synthetase TilS [Syntrophobacteraceae bacterium]
MVQKHSLQSRVLDFIRRHRMIRPGDNLLVGVSGGADSMALLHILKALELDLGLHRLTAAHFEHGLRGAESLEDRAFVERMSAELGVDRRCGAGDVRGSAREMRVSWEMAARFCRHRFFRSLATEENCRIALAHNANDQAEEILLRLCRGSGPSGLGGMRPLEESGIVRPLLFATRAEIQEYLESRGIPYRIDSSNDAPVCQRNRIRLEVLPLLERIMATGVVDCIQRHARLARDEEEYWKAIIADLWPKVCLSEGEGEVRLRTGEIRELHPAVARRVLRHAIDRLQGHLQGINARHIELISTLIREGRPGSGIHLPSSLRAGLQAQSLVLSLEKKRREAGPVPGEPWIIEGPGVWSRGSLSLKLQIREVKDMDPPYPWTSMEKHKASMDAEKICWPLCLRSRQPGDRFQPLGISGHKKLQDFFVDLKIPREMRKAMDILCDSEKICWILGHRLDDRVKVTCRTRRVLLIEVWRSGPVE